MNFWEEEYERNNDVEDDQEEDDEEGDVVYENGDFLSYLKELRIRHARNLAQIEKLYYQSLLVEAWEREQEGEKEGEGIYINMSYPYLS